MWSGQLADVCSLRSVPVSSNTRSPCGVHPVPPRLRSHLTRRRLPASMPLLRRHPLERPQCRHPPLVLLLLYDEHWAVVRSLPTPAYFSHSVDSAACGRAVGLPDLLVVGVHELLPCQRGLTARGDECQAKGTRANRGVAQEAWVPCRGYLRRDGERFVRNKSGPGKCRV